MVNDAHDTDIDFASDFLEYWLVPLMADSRFNNERTLILLSFDESESASPSFRCIPITDNSIRLYWKEPGLRDRLGTLHSIVSGGNHGQHSCVLSIGVHSLVADFCLSQCIATTRRSRLSSRTGDWGTLGSTMSDRTSLPGSRGLLAIRLVDALLSCESSARMRTTIQCMRSAVCHASYPKLKVR